MRKWCASALVFLCAWTAVPAAEKPLPQSWDYAAAMKKVAAQFHGRPGVVLHIGDSITYSNPYSQWTRVGEGKTDDDKAALKWMHAGADDVTDGGRRGRERIQLGAVELELGDPLDAGCTEAHWDTHVEVVDAVLTLEIRGAREHALLVEHDRVDHLRCCSTRRIPGGGSKQLDELAASLGGALDESRDPIRRYETP